MNVIIDNNPTTIQWNTNILCIKNKSFPFWMLKITIFQIGHKRDGCHFTFLILRLDLPPTPTFDIFLSSMSLVFFLSDFLSSHLSASVCISQWVILSSVSSSLFALHVENHLINIFSSLFTEKPSSRLTLGFRLSSASMTYFAVCNLQCTISRLFNQIILSVYNLHFTGSLPPLPENHDKQSNVCAFALMRIGCSVLKHKTQMDS